MRSLPILGATAKGKGEKGKERLGKGVMECGTAQLMEGERGKDWVPGREVCFKFR